jgi:hypothetical protein
LFLALLPASLKFCPLLSAFLLQTMKIIECTRVMSSSCLESLVDAYHRYPELKESTTQELNVHPRIAQLQNRIKYPGKLVFASRIHAIVLTGDV